MSHGTRGVGCLGRRHAHRGYSRGSERRSQVRRCRRVEQHQRVGIVLDNSRRKALGLRRLAAIEGHSGLSRIRKHGRAILRSAQTSFFLPPFTKHLNFTIFNNPRGTSAHRDGPGEETAGWDEP